MSPEAAARQKIDALLIAAGWAIQDYKAFNPGAARGIALREVPLDSGRCDYLLLVDRIPLGVIEAKKEGTTLSTVSDQSALYGESLPDFPAASSPRSTTSSTSPPSTLDTVARVTICTIQRLYSILRGEAEFDEDLDEKSAAELSAADARPKEVAYNAAVRLEAFDFIVTDECHRSIYGLWRQVLEYFDAHLLGLTATPGKQTVAFHQNLVPEYTHERAVADRVNVGYEVYRIKTEATARGGLIGKGFYVDRRSKETRARRLEPLDEDLPFAATDLDRYVEQLTLCCLTRAGGARGELARRTGMLGLLVSAQLTERVHVNTFSP